ncbi:MAG: hypothetical protein WC785_10905 [Tatlockia sp.]|jgi:hypothetical protein
MKIRFSTLTDDASSKVDGFLEMQIDKFPTIIGNMFDWDFFRQGIEEHCTKGEKLEIHFDYFHAAMVSFVQCIKQHFTIIATYNASLPEIDTLKTLLSTVEGKEEEFDTDTEHEILVKQYLRGEQTLEAFKADYSVLLRVELPGTDDKVRAERVEDEVARVEKLKALLQTTGVNDCFQSMTKEEIAFRQGLEQSRSIFKQYREENKLADKITVINEDPTPSAPLLILNGDEQKNSGNLNNIQEYFGQPKKPQSQLERDFLKQFGELRSESLGSGFFCGALNSTNLKQKALNKPEAILNHAKKGRFFGFFDNRTCSILKKMNVLDAKGELVDDNPYQLKRNNK